MDKELQEKFDLLPPDVQNALKSKAVVEAIQILGKEHSLHTDQLGSLEDCVSRVMIGIDKTTDFVSAIEEKVGVSTDEAIQIATDVNTQIFLPIRESLMNMEERPSLEQSHPESLERDSILAEIENPTPFQHPISADRPHEPTPAPNILPVITGTPTPVTNTSVAHEFIAGKMSEQVSMPPQKYSADPYREPLA